MSAKPPTNNIGYLLTIRSNFQLITITLSAVSRTQMKMRGGGVSLELWFNHNNGEALMTKHTFCMYGSCQFLENNEPPDITMDHFKKIPLNVLTAHSIRSSAPLERNFVCFSEGGEEMTGKSSSQGLFLGLLGCSLKYLQNT